MVFQNSEWGAVLNELWNKPLSLTFRNEYLDGKLRDKSVTKPRCPAGSLVEIALRPDEEDIVEFIPPEKSLLRKALVLSNMTVQEPSWLSEEQPIQVDSKLKKTHRRKSKRRRERADDEQDVENKKRKITDE
eukprot:jgi/Galph1/4934/GphlegSOOS_G3553.1